MPYAASVFQQLLEPLDRRILNRIVAAHDGDRWVGSGANAWTCVRHLRTMLFAQFAGLGSLCEIEQGLAAHPGGLYHLDLRLPRRSTLSDAQAHRPAAVFRDICQMMIGQVSRAVRQEGKALIQLIDGSPIVLRESALCLGPGRSAGPRAQAPCRLRSARRRPRLDRNRLAPGQRTQRRAQQADRAGHGLCLRQGVSRFWLGHAIDAAGAVFVTRSKTNTKRRDVRARVVPVQARDAGILEDNAVKIGHAAPRGGARNPLFDTPLREILVARDGKAPMRLVTNDLARPATEIAALYKERWQIELLFKGIKQNLKIKRFLGRSENAVNPDLHRVDRVRAAAHAAPNSRHRASAASQRR